MSCACRRQYARIKPKAVDLDETELRLRMAAQKWLKRLSGNAFGASDGDMRTKGSEVRFETRLKDRILNPSVQCKKMRMTFSDAHPDHRWPAARVKDTDAAEGQKKRWNPHFAQSLTQPTLRGCFHFAEKTERQVKLLLREPAQAGKMRVETKQRRFESWRKFEANEKPFRGKHGKKDRIQEYRSTGVQEFSRVK
jgi:hypothetical protein